VLTYNIFGMLSEPLISVQVFSFPLQRCIKLSLSLHVSHVEEDETCSASYETHFIHYQSSLLIFAYGPCFAVIV
jgi:hypothetical protein